MRVLLISTYELGHQPLGVAAAAAELRAAGHVVSALDLAVEPWSEERLASVDAVAVSVPMHTALRLAVEVGIRVRRSRPDLPIAFYGLYAGVGASRTLGTVADRLICGEYEDGLVAWAGSLASPQPESGTTIEIGRRKFLAPARDLLPPLDRYAHLATPDGHRLVGSVVASHGCRHRCRHCPVPAVYDGRYRITGEDTVVADIAQLVDAGATHISFGDPDFLNAPAYSLSVVERAHGEFPDLTFDVTVKVEHILNHRRLLGRLAAAGVLFMVSAFETLEDGILDRLDKGHTAEDAGRAVDLARAVGIDIHPTWLPFTPWTTLEGVAAIARFVWERDLADVTHPVQMSIRLLIPDGSVLLGVDDLDPHLTGYDPEALGYTWRAADPEVDRLQLDLAGLAQEGADTGEPATRTLAEMSRLIGERSGEEIPVGMIPAGAVAGRPRLTEPWFC